jgi:protein gp37
MMPAFGFAAMATSSNIEWTDASWNCLAGCEAVSPGCAHCYAATMTRRLEAMGQADYTGLTTAKHFNGTVRCLPDKLTIPLKWRKPRRVFVNSMSDLFHEDVPDEFIDRVFAVMAVCPQHTFQVLTKRAERMSDYCRRLPATYIHQVADDFGALSELRDIHFPLPNVWLGVSAEDQQRADERIPWLLKTPAAVRFVSAEPLLGPIDFLSWLALGPGKAAWHLATYGDSQPLHWIIVGGESGSGARPCNADWVRSIVGQCKAAGVVACFVKQMGSNLVDGGIRLDGTRTDPQRVLLSSRKGGDPTEWPGDLRVREFPDAKVAT